jgi:hypothetical protein
MTSAPLLRKSTALMLVICRFSRKQFQKLDIFLRSPHFSRMDDGADGVIVQQQNKGRWGVEFANGRALSLK